MPQKLLFAVCLFFGVPILLTCVTVGDLWWQQHVMKQQEEVIPVPADFTSITAEQEKARQTELDALERPTHDVGKESREKYPGMGFCYRCGRTWNVIEDSPAEALQPANKAHQEKTHDIVYLRDNRGQMLGSCFPCCEECWQKSNLEERLKYARTLCDAWRIDQHYAPAEWNLNDDIDAKQVLIEAEIHREWEAKQRNEITPIDN